MADDEKAAPLSNPAEGQELAELQRKNAELRAQLATAIREDYEGVVRRMCEREQENKLHGFLAQLVLRTLDRGLKEDRGWEIRTILDCVEANFKVESWWLRSDTESEDINHLVWRFFESVSEHFSYHLNSYVYDSDGGLPLYSKNESGQYERGDSSNADFVFVRSITKHDAMRNDYTSPPAWTKSLYVKKTDVEAFLLFHGDGYSEQAKMVRAAALRAFLDGKLDVSPEVKATGTSSHSRVHLASFQHETKLLRVLETTRERYYGKNFVPNDPETLPKQTDVVAWLMATYSLSKREAEAIDIVTRPESARRR